jgi:hypothetical protein
MLFMNLQKVYGVWQVDSKIPCPFGTGMGQGNEQVKFKNLKE